MTARQKRQGELTWPGSTLRKQSVQPEEGQDCEDDHHGAHKPDYVVHGGSSICLGLSDWALGSSACRPGPDPTYECRLRGNNRKECSIARYQANRLGNGSSQRGRHVWTRSQQIVAVTGSLTNGTGSQLPGGDKKARSEWPSTSSVLAFATVQTPCEAIASVRNEPTPHDTVADASIWMRPQGRGERDRCCRGKDCSRP